MIIEAFSALWYQCPTCNTENIISVNSPYFQKGFRCKKCQTNWNLDNLYEAYGTIFPSKDKMNLLSTEFTCECGHVNLIFFKITETSDESFNEYYRINIEGGEAPKFGLCEQCGTGYNLVYPIGETIERYLKDGGFPFEGADEEKQKWLEENA